ncbi:MAG: glucose-1-phosphate thymidylyltransferase RfbA [Candidatus Neomarinimicrobiota bacterium]|nr:glucose-1-phosphate thymidylyltransferase RfbA [Candidatus Neomarinimicrobiota bacterium]
MKGIILAGGSGTRLYPLTEVASKQLMPVYDKPMIYYPLSTLMLLGIRDILIISTPADIPKFKDLFGDGKNIGLSIKYEVQKKPNGIAEAFIIGKNFINKSSVSLILGDNLFYGHKFLNNLSAKFKNFNGATILGYKVRNPERYGVVEFDNCNKVISIEEKPKIPKTNYAIPGLYIYDNKVIQIAEKLKPSKRGELEITDVNKEYLKKKLLNIEILGRGIAWLDTGTHKNLLEAGSFIQTIESRQGLKIGCIEEIALHKGYINKTKFVNLYNTYPENEYKEYLKRIII